MNSVVFFLGVVVVSAAAYDPNHNHVVEVAPPANTQFEEESYDYETPSGDQCICVRMVPIEAAVPEPIVEECVNDPAQPIIDRKAYFAADHPSYGKNPYARDILYRGQPRQNLGLYW